MPAWYSFLNSADGCCACATEIAHSSTPTATAAESLIRQKGYHRRGAARQMALITSPKFLVISPIFLVIASACDARPRPLSAAVRQPDADRCPARGTAS